MTQTKLNFTQTRVNIYARFTEKLVGKNFPVKLMTASRPKTLQVFKLFYDDGRGGAGQSYGGPPWAFALSKRARQQQQQPCQGETISKHNKVFI